MNEQPEQPGEAKERAKNHLGEAIDALQNAGLTNEEIAPVESVLRDL